MRGERETESALASGVRLFFRPAVYRSVRAWVTGPSSSQGVEGSESAGRGAAEERVCVFNAGGRRT